MTGLIIFASVVLLVVSSISLLCFYFMSSLGWRIQSRLHSIKWWKRVIESTKPFTRRQKRLATKPRATPIYHLCPSRNDDGGPTDQGFHRRANEDFIWAVTHDRKILAASILNHVIKATYVDNETQRRRDAAREERLRAQYTNP
jgi:hypothetical protein